MFRKLFAVSLVAAVAALSPVLAAENFKIFADATWISPLGDTTFSDLGDGDYNGVWEAKSDFGFNVGFEWRWSELLGLEFDYLWASTDVEVEGNKVSSLDYSPLSASLNIHLIHADFDLWVAPTISWVNFSDIELENFDVGTDSEFAWGATVGAAFYFTDRIGIEGALRYTDVSVSGDYFGNKLPIDPLTLRAGVAFRF